MLRYIPLLSFASVAVFGGGSLRLSVTLSALRDEPIAGASTMQLLLPAMGGVMAPLLGIALLSSAGTAWLAQRAHLPSASTTWAALTAVLLIAVVTAAVHLPINAQLLAGKGLEPAHAAALLGRWLSFHHVRTALALMALGLLLWPLRPALPHP